MAAISGSGFLARLFGSDSPARPAKRSTRIYTFIKKAHKETHGATPDLKRVYQAYLDSTKRKSSAG